MRNHPKTYSLIKESSVFLKIVSLLLILVVLFQPTSSLIESLDNDLEVAIMDIDFNDSQEEDSQEKEETIKELNPHDLTQETFSISKSSPIRFYRMPYSEHKQSIITPPPELA